MVTLDAGAGHRCIERWLLAGGVVVSAVMPVAPVAVPVGLGLIVWSAILLGRRPHRRAGALIATIGIIGVACLVVVAVGVVTLAAASTPDTGITLIRG